MKIPYYDKLKRILIQNKLLVDYFSYIIFKLHLNIYYENEYRNYDIFMNRNKLS